MARMSIGLIYEAEKPEHVPTILHEPLAVRPKHNMRYGKIEGLAKSVSRLLMGVDNVIFASRVGQ